MQSTIFTKTEHIFSYKEIKEMIYKHLIECGADINLNDLSIAVVADEFDEDLTSESDCISAITEKKIRRG